MRGLLVALENGRLDQKLSIHDAIGRKMLALDQPSYESRRYIYDKWAILRQSWFDAPDLRGRANASSKASATTLGGIVRKDQTGVGDVDIDRNRGVDMYQRDTNRKRDYAASDNYYSDLDCRNLLFGAGISGTTGTLLQAAFAFTGELLKGELLKQYVLAVIGYLVGGGMHSYHESMAVAEKAGVPYQPGRYIQSLPDSFLASQQFKEWKVEYYDIVMMGATHWRYNDGFQAPQTNPKLKTA
jgi:hypothetical protein